MIISSVLVSLGYHKKQHYKLDGLNNRRLFPHSSGCCEVAIRVPAWLGPGEGFDLLCTLTTSSLHALREME